MTPSIVLFDHSGSCGVRRCAPKMFQHLKVRRDKRSKVDVIAGGGRKRCADEAGPCKREFGYVTKWVEAWYDEGARVEVQLWETRGWVPQGRGEVEDGRYLGRKRLERQPRR